MLFPESQLAQLPRLLGTDDSRLRSAAIDVGVAPLDMVRAGSRLSARSSYFRTPEGDEMASLGIALRISAAGPDRFAGLQAQLDAVPELVAGSRFTIGFSFSPQGPSAPEWGGFTSADMVLPAVSLIRSGMSIRLVAAVPPGGSIDGLMEMLAGLQTVAAPALPDPGSHIVESIPTSADWQSEVAETIGAIKDGSLDKVVLARSVLVRSERATDPYDLVHHLRAANPSCYVYAAVAGESAFVGASPELLLSQTGREIKLNPLAGSARRGKGADDTAVGQELLASAKDRAEHAIVVDDLVSRLAELTADLDHSQEPSLRRMATVQHLSTEIAGTLRTGVSTFDVLRSIHPTPAVGGNPRTEALAFIDKVEGIDRGWYAGGVGWVSPEDGAQVALALRCALIKGATSRLYAGNGIVAESDPAAELIETRLKFQPLLNLLAVT